LGEISRLEERIQGLGFSRVLGSEIGFLPAPTEDVLVLDSYVINPSNPFVQRDNWLAVVSIADDLTPIYGCDLMVHPGLDTDWLSNTAVPILAGAEYILTRKSIKKVKPGKIDIQKGPKILVVGGGSDPYGFCEAIAENLDSIQEPFEVNFLSNSHIASKADKKFQTHPIGAIIDELVNTADLVLTTASTTSLEFIGREIPAGVACVVENQENYYLGIGRLGIAKQIGVRNTDGAWQLDFDAIEGLVTSDILRNSLRARSANLIDLRGAERVLDYIEKNYS
jgi:spore coat polysaccharide biosynthesis predicted glycosyltransferase SpsG